MWYHFLMENKKNTAASTLDMVTISRAKYDPQQAQPTLCPGNFASPEVAAHIMTLKFVMYSPLYRLEQEFQR